MVQFLSIIFFFLDFFNFCWVFQKFPFFGVTLYFRKQIKEKTKPRIRNITAQAALKFGSEAWVLRKRQEQRSEAAQMKFLRPLLGTTKPDK